MYIYTHTHIYIYCLSGSLPQWLSGKEFVCNTGVAGQEFYPQVGKIAWRRAWQPTVVFLPGDSHGHKSLEGYSP